MNAGHEHMLPGAPPSTHVGTVEQNGPPSVDGSVVVSATRAALNWMFVHVPAAWAVTERRTRRGPTMPAALAAFNIVLRLSCWFDMRSVQRNGRITEQRPTHGDIGSGCRRVEIALGGREGVADRIRRCNYIHDESAEHRVMHFARQRRGAQHGRHAGR